MHQQKFECVLVDLQKIGPNLFNPLKNEFYVTNIFTVSRHLTVSYLKDEQFAVVCCENHAKQGAEACGIYRGADKSLARPGRKQDNVCQNGVNFLRRASLTCFRACFLPGRAKVLSAPRYRNKSA
jgi:hypothetical protein